MNSIYIAPIISWVVLLRACVSCVSYPPHFAIKHCARARTRATWRHPRNVLFSTSSYYDDDSRRCQVQKKRVEKTGTLKPATSATHVVLLLWHLVMSSSSLDCRLCTVGRPGVRTRGQTPRHCSRSRSATEKEKAWVADVQTTGKFVCWVFLSIFQSIYNRTDATP